MMRRQVKPFVTEYRGSGRRPKELPFRETREDEDQKIDLFGAPPQTSGGRSYEAALRAADALFAPQRAAPEQTPGTIAKSELGADIGSATLFADAKPHSSEGGRILHAIEPVEQVAPPPRMERVPARRGRKPGSKNKPKPVMIGTVDAAVLAPAIMAVSAVAAPSVARAAHGSKTYPKAPPAPTNNPPAPAATRKRVDSFAWVRTTLRPGEKWKLRLPKVIW